jgi:Mg-chelatase subunit ChlD
MPEEVHVMRRWSRLLVALTVWVAALALGATVAGTAGARGVAQAQSPCTVVPDKVAAPTEIPLGARVRVTLTLTASCPSEAAPVDVMLVLDASASMADNRKLANAKVAAKAFVDAMDLTQSRVGLVAFNQDAGVRTPLIQNAKRIKSDIDSLIAGGRTNISQAIDVARGALGDAGPERSLAMVVLTDGYNTISSADPVPVASDRAKAMGIKVATFCAGGDCDPGLQPAASAPELYFNVPDASRLAALYTALAGSLQANAVVTLTIRDEIPANMRYIAGSARPAPAEVGANFLLWRLNGLPGPEGLSYELQPLEEGLHPTNVIAVGDFTDRRGLPGHTVFPVPKVRVIAPPCPPQPLDLYFLIDDSNCLQNAFLNNMPAREAIVIGVQRVLDMMSLGRDRAAVIGFGDAARTYQAMTTERQKITDAARAISMLDNSARMDLGLREVQRQIAQTARPGALVMTLTITDGPMNAPLLTTEQIAFAMRGQGVRHYTIGVGDLAQYNTLRVVAEPGGMRELDFGGDVISAYVDLGGMIMAVSRECLPAATPTAPAAQR